MPVLMFDSVTKLLEKLCLIQGTPMSGSWLFRGQGDARWGLVPSLFRKGLGLADEKEERAFEGSILHFLRRQLQTRATLPERLILDDKYVLALAQHYGAPTRLLDWTRSPLAAAYFAASSALRLREGAALAIFAIARICDLVNSESPITEVPSGGNDYLEAQSGVFVLHDWSCRDYWREEYNKRTESPAEINARFIRLELPSNTAGELLDEVRRRGVDMIGLFPGMLGFVSNAADFAWKSVAAVRG